MYKLSADKTFIKQYSKLSKSEQSSVDKKIKLLAEDPWHPSLRVKKIRSTEEFECSVNMDIRLAFAFMDDVIILLLDIDHHDKLLQRRTRRS